MLSPIEELKIQAKKRLRETPSIPGLFKLSKNNPPKLKHCQLMIARQYGFRDWEHARLILSCESYRPGDDCGSFWYSNRCTTLLNHWCGSYQDALSVQQELGGIILPYKTQFVVAKRPYLSFIGMDYSDPLWAEIEYSWCCGAVEVRKALALKRIVAVRNST